VSVSIDTRQTSESWVHFIAELALDSLCIHAGGELDPKLRKGSSRWQQDPVGREGRSSDSVYVIAVPYLHLCLQVLR
jgi:hypothetical protein